MEYSHLKLLELRRAAFYRTVQFVVAIPINAFMMVTLNHPGGLFGARNELTPADLFVWGGFCALGFLGMPFMRRPYKLGFHLYTAAFLSLVPWCLLTFTHDWLMSVIALLLNGGIGLSMLIKTRQRFATPRPLRMPQPDMFGRWGPPLLWLNCMAVVMGVLEIGYQVVTSSIGLASAALVIGGALILSIAVELRYRTPEMRTRSQIEWLLLLVLIISALADFHLPRILGLAALRQGVVALQYSLRTRHALVLQRYFFRRPAQLSALSFMFLISLGSLVLSFPDVARSGHSIHFINALFTATSAVCVTGLTVLDTATDFTLLGQLVILCLIQAGGLGIMTLSTFAALMIGRNIGLGQEYSLIAIMGESSVALVYRLIKFICIFTFTIEAVGALVIFPQLLALGIPWKSALWKAVFHSISAFCNAGFALQSDNLMSWRQQPGILLTLSALIIVGGLGFGVLYWCWQRVRGVRVKATLHARIVLWGTMVLLTVGTFALFCTEFHHALRSLPLRDKLVNAWFHAVTPRTAGFNTLALEAFQPLSRFLTMVLMFIGAGPNSTSGGIKITTVFVLILTVRTLMRGSFEVHGFGYSIGHNTVYRTAAVLTLGLTSCAAALMVLLVTEPIHFERLAFEVLSAFGTVGLSMNVTPYLSPIGKLVIIALMFIGRVGALTLVLSFQPMRKEEIIYPKANVMVG
ncbi:MAG: TrkH family potassium uptake protein [bacterium]|nr:TrkH family potassium uptake protein [bacterium]